MSLCSFAEGAAMYDATPIENLFLMEYLPTAPEDCLRVYLYMRMVSLHPELGSDLAAAAKLLRLTEDAVLNAMLYWERVGLARRLSDRPPTFALLRVQSPTERPSSELDQSYYRFRDFNAKLQSYFKANDLISPKEYAMAADWVTVMGFEQDAALRMVKHVLDTGRARKPDSVFKRADKLAVQWADRGISTLEAVERAILEDTQYFRIAQGVLQRLNVRRYPTADEVRLVERWMEEWHFDEAAIYDVCKASTGAQFPSFNFLNSVLQNRMNGSDALRTELIAILKELDPKSPIPTPTQLKRYAEFRAMGFGDDTVRLAATQCHSTRRTRFEDLETMLMKWYERRLTSFDAAEAYVSDMQARKAIVEKMFDDMGIRRRPGLKEIEESLTQWRALGSDALIEYAVSLSRGKNAPLEYFEMLLKSWHESGIATVDEAKAQHAAMTAKAPTAQKPVSEALNYDQRTYTAADFGEDFFTDPDKA